MDSPEWQLSGALHKEGRSCTSAKPNHTGCSPSRSALPSVAGRAPVSSALLATSRHAWRLAADLKRLGIQLFSTHAGLTADVTEEPAWTRTSVCFSIDHNTNTYPIFDISCVISN